jgi:hypothetical protein
MKGMREITRTLTSIVGIQTENIIPEFMKSDNSSTAVWFVKSVVDGVYGAKLFVESDSHSVTKEIPC